MNLEDHELAELLTLTRTVSKMGVIRYKNHLDQLHRVHGPAIICDDGSKEWYLDGNRHRTDGPAVIRRDGDELWYLNGRYHRTDGPAVKSANGDETWYVNGRPHRIDGPAISWIGSKSWYLHGDYLTEEEWNERIQSL